MNPLKPLSAAVLLALTTQVQAAEETDVETLAEEVAELKQQVRDLRIKTAGNHLNFSVDYRVTHDTLEYKLTDGSTVKNNSLLANRLYLKMGYKYSDNLVFKGVLAYNKAFGDTANHAQRNQSGFADFDWVINENLHDNGLNLKEAYFLYLADSLFGNEELPWTFSLGRRPSTNGFLGNHREGDAKPNSPLAHSINVDFDGLSLNFKLDKITGVTGQSFKICAGRGLSNATSRFEMTGTDYAKDSSQTDNIDMIGFIYTPYADGQYNVMAQVYHANNMIGYDSMDVMANMMSGKPMMEGVQFKDFGDLDNATLSVEVNGIGELINDFLDGTRVFASFSVSRTDPNTGMRMLGSTKKERGNSIWLGVNVPGFLGDDSFGLEYNKGSKYWRSFTYGEDTMIGSKLATRGNAIEAYWNVPLIDDALTFQLRYTKIDYDYTGSNFFFGDLTGTPMDLAMATMMNQQMGMPAPVESASDLRATLRYKF